MSFLFARPARRVPLLVLTSHALAVVPALAEASGHAWQKTYSLSGSPSLTIETGDSGLDIRSCGECKEIRIDVNSARDLNEYNLEAHQQGDRVYFSLKEKPHLGMHFNWKSDAGTKVSVETPVHLELDAKTSDGNLSVREIAGNLQIRAGDGSVTLDDVQGTIRLTASDGNVVMRRASGTLEARGADGHMEIDGQFTAVQLHTSDGNLDLTLAPGSQLNAASRIESSDGQVNIRVPQTLAADVDVSTSDGHVDCNLPLTVDHYDSRDSGGHHLHGRLNAGGMPFSIHTSDGNVRIAAL